MFEVLNDNVLTKYVAIAEVKCSAKNRWFRAEFSPLPLANKRIVWSGLQLNVLLKTRTLNHINSMLDMGVMKDVETIFG